MRVLIAGTARCGSTWVANVLGRSDDTRLVFEPDGPASDLLGAISASRLGPHVAINAGERSLPFQIMWDLAFVGGWPMARSENVRAAGRRVVRMPRGVRDTLVLGLAFGTSRARRSPANVIVKSVNASFALDWIAKRYQPRIVVMRRNLLNVVSSCVVLGLYMRTYFGDLPRVRQRYVEPLGLGRPGEGASPVELVAWNVGLLTLALQRSAVRHPDWVVVSHDELCRDPVRQFEAVAGRLGLGWTPAMEDYIRQSDDPGFTVFGGSQRVHPNAGSSTTTGSRRLQQSTQYLRRLSPEDRRHAAAVLARFPLGDWGLDGFGD